jgi:hypothetical protein
VATFLHLVDCGDARPLLCGNMAAKLMARLAPGVDYAPPEEYLPYAGEPDTWPPPRKGLAQAD